jgi:hypothetical protein
MRTPLALLETLSSDIRRQKFTRVWVMIRNAVAAQAYRPLYQVVFIRTPTKGEKLDVTCHLERGGRVSYLSKLLQPNLRRS